VGHGGRPQCGAVCKATESAGHGAGARDRVRGRPWALTPPAAARAVKLSVIGFGFSQVTPCKPEESPAFPNRFPPDCLNPEGSKRIRDLIVESVRGAGGEFCAPTNGGPPFRVSRRALLGYEADIRGVHGRIQWPRLPVLCTSVPTETVREIFLPFEKVRQSRG